MIAVKLSRGVVLFGLARKEPLLDCDHRGFGRQTQVDLPTTALIVDRQEQFLSVVLEPPTSGTGVDLNPFVGYPNG